MRQQTVTCDRCGGTMGDEDQASGVQLIQIGGNAQIDLHRRCADQLKDWLNHGQADQADTVDP